MKKIMFNDKFGLTKAVLEGRKTMTRRIADSEGDIDNMEFKFFQDGKAVFASATGVARIEPKYKVGEVVAVAQSYLSIHNEMMDNSFGEGYEDAIYDPFRWAIVDDKPGWSNKMFVKADLMPHRIRITNVRVERLQDISDEDCFREGIYKKTLCPPGDIDYFYHSEPRSKLDVYPSAREAFAGLIDKVSGKGTWKSNPWVFVYQFEIVK